MGIRVANPGGLDPHQDILSPNLRHRYLLHLKGLVYPDHTDGFHVFNLLLGYFYFGGLTYIVVSQVVFRKQDAEIAAP
jgi:hypothetical protein